jgi:pyruvate formate lyase activating enzyme
MHSLIFNIQRFSIHDGPGIRTTVFLKGCPLRCIWCQNPESIEPKKEILFSKKLCIGCGRCREVCENGAILPDSEQRIDRKLCDSCGKCVERCYAGALRMAGKKLSSKEVIEEVKRDKPFYKNSGGGVTFSGGEPIMQADPLSEILIGCREEGIHTCVETSGFAPFSSFEKIMEYTDLFLYDLKLMDSEKHKMFTGVGNEVILRNAVLLIKNGISVEFRMPLIPGYNDGEENIRKVCDFLLRNGKRKIEILPYHRYGISKYEQLGRKYELPDLLPPSEALLEKIEGIFSRNGIKVEMG